MRIRLLGTGAAEGIPAFCADTPVSNYAREHGGKDIRSRCGALVDHCLKLDLPPDTLMQMHRDRVDARDWTALLFTHSDDDHFAPSEIQYALYPFNNRENLRFTIYANSRICELLKERYPQWPMEIVQTNSFEPFSHQTYTITPIRANHKPDEDAHNYIIQHEGRTLLYATDTGVWGEPTWEFLCAFKLDALVLECTEGLVPSAFEGHLDVLDFLSVVQRLREQGTVSADTTLYTTHHSHNGGATHAQLEEAMTPHGVLVGFDGAEFEV